jgi:hypothetical protein
VPNRLACFVLKIDGSGGWTALGHFYTSLGRNLQRQTSTHSLFVCPTWAVTKTAHVIKKPVSCKIKFSPRKMNDFSAGGKMLSEVFSSPVKFQVLDFRRRASSWLAACFLHSPLSASIFSPEVVQGERVNRRDSETRLRLLRRRGAHLALSRPGDKFESCLRPTETLSTYYN